MLGMLLITGKNGRTVKPYGLHRLYNYNMKFTFTCIVITISCSVCASGDLEIYPDLKRPLSSDISEDTPLFRLWPWQFNRADDYRETKKKAPGLRMDISDLINAENEIVYHQPENSKHRYRVRPQYNYLFKMPRHLAFPDSDGGGTMYQYPDDLTYDEPVDFVDEIDEKSEHREREIVKEPSEDKVEALETVVEATSKSAIEEPKFVDDPTQFAYPPSDVRFFKNADFDDNIRTSSEKLPDNIIQLNHRSEEAFLGDFDTTEGVAGRRSDNQVEVVAMRPQIQNAESAGVYIIAVVAGISAAATVGLIAVGMGWYNLQKHVKNASDVEYPAYGVTGPNKDSSPSGDRRLAQSAQMYHYQHQKQQIIAMESSRAAAGDRHGSVSEGDSDEEIEEGDYTVYECPGLAPTGEMEVKNPLFQDDPTPAQTPPVKPNGGGEEKK